MRIAGTDRVSTVIGHDESLIDVFVSLSPAFERLRSAGMRRVMSRLVTVEQAARMAGIDAQELVSRLNEHESAAATNRAAPTKNEGRAMPIEAGARPDALENVAPGDVVELDVREELRAGREPFSLIMAALRTVPEGGVFCVRAIFEPVPLYAVMKRQGFEHWTERLEDDDWRVWFHPAAGNAPPAPDTASPAGSQPSSARDAASSAEENVVILDVRDLEPPEPMMRTLAALEQLPAGATLLQINVRVPQFLLPLLEERGFTYDVREQEPDLVRVFIRHAR